MANLTIDNKVYDIEKLSPEAKAKIDSARFCESKIEQLEAELSIVRTARAAYLQALTTLLDDKALVKEAGKAATKTEKAPAAKKAKASTKH